MSANRRRGVSAGLLSGVSTSGVSGRAQGGGWWSGQEAWAGGGLWVAWQAPSQASCQDQLGGRCQVVVASAAGWAGGDLDEFVADGRPAGVRVSGGGQGAQHPGEGVCGGGELEPGGVGLEVC
jgi:hypothetical protein